MLCVGGQTLLPAFPPAFSRTAVTVAMESGWRAAESRPSVAARNFSRALSGKA